MGHFKLPYDTSFIISAVSAHWTTSPAATPIPGVVGATPCLLVDGPTPTPYMPGATPPLYVSGAMPSPLRTTSVPPIPHNLSHFNARDAAQSAAKKAGQCLKKNFTHEENNTMTGVRYCCEVEFLHSSGRLCKGRSCFQTSKDTAEEEACRNLLIQNSELLQSTLTADAAIGTHHSMQPSIKPTTLREGTHLGPPPMGGAAWQTVSVTARSVTTPPPSYQEHPQCGIVSIQDQLPSSVLPTATNYQGHPQGGSAPPTPHQVHHRSGNTTLSATHQGQPQPNSGTKKTPKMELKEYCDRMRWPLPQYSTSHSGTTFQSTVLVRGLGMVTGSEQTTKKSAEHDAAAKAMSQLS